MERARPIRLVVAIALLAIVTAGAAQRVRLDRGGTVAFVPSGEELVAAYACPPDTCLGPTPGSPRIALSVLRQNPRNDNDLVLDLSPWSLVDDGGAGGPELELFVRLELDGNRSGRSVTEWTPLGRGARRIALPDDPRVDVAAVFRLRPGASASAGLASATLRYELAGRSVEHPVTVGVPDVTFVRVVGGAAAAAADVTFDYGADALAFLAASDVGSGLPVTSASLRGVEVFSTSRTGWEVAVSVTDLSPGATWPDGLLRLDGVRAEGWTVRGTGPTSGFETVLTVDDYSVWPSGDERAGRFAVQLTFRAAALR